MGRTFIFSVQHLHIMSVKTTVQYLRTVYFTVFFITYVNTVLFTEVNTVQYIFLQYIFFYSTLLGKYCAVHFTVFSLRKYCTVP